MKSRAASTVILRANMPGKLSLGSKSGIAHGGIFLLVGRRADDITLHGSADSDPADDLGGLGF